MSLHDIDKYGDRRGISRLNQNDRIKQRMAHKTNQTTYRTENGPVPRVSFLQGLIVTYDNENRISSVYGYIPEVSQIPVLIIAKEGYDVFEDVLEITRPTV